MLKPFEAVGRYFDAWDRVNALEGLFGSKRLGETGHPFYEAQRGTVLKGETVIKDLKRLGAGLTVVSIPFLRNPLLKVVAGAAAFALWQNANTHAGKIREAQLTHTNLSQIFPSRTDL